MSIESYEKSVPVTLALLSNKCGISRPIPVP
jgi:hypothetical protein